MLSLIPVVGPILAIIVVNIGSELVLDILLGPLHIATSTVLVLDAPITALIYALAF